MAEALTAESPNSVIADQGLVYCRLPNGEVVACDASPMELMKKINRGVQVLTDYGQFGSTVYYMEHPYEPLFQAGGAHELSPDQVIDMGYHLRPPLVPTCQQHVGASKEHLTHVGRPGGRTAQTQGCWRGARPAHFPQLEGFDVPEAPAECEFCGRDDLPTQRALSQHQEVMHTERRQQQDLGQAIVAGLQRGGVIGGGGSSASDIAAAVAAALQTLGYGTRTPGPDPIPDDDDEEDEDQPEAPEPQPAPAPEPAARRPVSQAQLDSLARARAARGYLQRIPTSDD